MIKKDDVKHLLDELNLGASTAENDPLLEVAKIETQQFSDLYDYDRVDIIRGIKGAGKTALYRLFFLLKNYLMEKRDLYIVFGVEATGDPLFRLFQDDFESYSEVEFENFWGIYFIVLVYKLIFNIEGLKFRIGSENEERIDQLLKKMGIRIEKNGFVLKDVQCSILDRFKQSKLKMGFETKVDPVSAVPTAFQPTIEFEPVSMAQVSKTPIYLADFRDMIVSILGEKKIKIWIMLDRLDEIFPHRSPIERNGLRGLLKAAYNFSNPHVRVKTFLRDDIIDYLASSANGFTALTHVTDRCSTTMSWSKEDILHLIVKRISAIKYFNYHFSVDPGRIDVEQKYREEVFYKLFPAKIGKIATFDWLFASCSDANDVVTPRDIIDFFRFAKAVQYRKFKLNPQDQESLVDENTFKETLGLLSKHKKTTFLFAEFPHLKDYILKFDGGCSEHNADSLRQLLGEDWQKIVEELKSIGLIKHIPKSAVYKIPIIWRKGLNIKRAKAFKSEKQS